MKYILSAILLFIAIGLTQAQEERKFIRKGNDQFTTEKYLESEIEYRKALDKEKDSYEAQFNLGDALFKQEKYDEAMNQFQVLAGTETAPERLAQVFHNIGNGYMAMQKIPEAIEAYKNALRNNPMDNDTRYNLIAAQKMLQQQQQDQQKQDQNKDQDQQNKEQQKQEQQEQNQQQQEQQQQEQQEQEQQEQQNNPNQQQQQQQQQPEEQMSKEDAQRLLNAIEQDENALQKKLRKAKASQRPKTEKNW